MNHFEKTYRASAAKRTRIGYKNTYRKPLVTDLGTDFAGVLGTAGGPGNNIYRKEELNATNNYK